MHERWTIVYYKPTSHVGLRLIDAYMVYGFYPRSKSTAYRQHQLNKPIFLIDCVVIGRHHHQGVSGA
jgi:hypothetical protein